MSAVIAVMNHKGGVGKTTTTLNLASAMAAAGKRVLIIDMDPQSNAATGLGVDGKSLERGTYELILGEARLDNVCLKTDLPNVDLVPATFQLAALSTVPSDTEAPEYWLREVLAEENPDFDFILIDCPPSFGILSLNALVAAQKVIVPVQSESFAIAGLQQMEESIARIRHEADHPLEYRILMTLNDNQQNLHKLVDQEIRNHFGDQVFKTAIPVEPKIAESAFMGRPVVVHSPSSEGARAYIRACIDCLDWVQPLGDALNTLEQKIINSVNVWVQDQKVTVPGAPAQTITPPSPVSAPIQNGSGGNFRTTIRNGVIMAVALTIGMALAMLGLN